MNPNSDNPPVKLSKKRKRFIDEYCIDLNATQAAIRAGYSKATAYSIGHEILNIPEIAVIIESRLQELSMKAGEAAARLTEWGRGSFEPFVKQDSETGIVLDLTKEDAMKKIHLIKKMKQTKRTLFNKEGEVFGEEITTEIELHDAMSAVDKIAKFRGMYADKLKPGTEGEDKEVEEVRITIVSKNKDQNPPSNDSQFNR